MSAMKQLFETLAGADLPEWQTFAAHVRRLEIAPGAVLFEQDAPHPCVYVIGQGLLKLVYRCEDGTEWIKSFPREGQLFASVAALEPGGRTAFAAIALEPTGLEQVDHAVIERLGERHLAWQTLLRRAFQQFGARKERRERELLVLSAEERYRRFLQQNPELDGRILQQDLSRHLGITPVGLSRIRARLRRAATDAPDGIR